MLANADTQRSLKASASLLQQRFSSFVQRPNDGERRVGEGAGRGVECEGQIGLFGSCGGSQLSGPFRQLRLELVRTLGRFKHLNGNAYVVGGTLRDLILGPAKVGSAWKMPRDIDIVVQGVSLNALENSFKDLITRRTRFGGLHLTRTIRGVKLEFDVWPLEDSWAFRNYPITAGIENFPLTPFLNLDSIAIGLRPLGRLGRPVYERGFFDGVETETIEINFEPNPFPDVCMVRALLMAAKLQFSIGERLARFIYERAEQTTVSALLQAQISHYQQERCGRQELTEWINTVRTHLDFGHRPIRLNVGALRQLELWNDYPALHGTRSSSSSELWRTLSVLPTERFPKGRAP